MKIQKTSTQQAFQPIEFKITIESQEEYDAMQYLYMNSGNIYNASIDVIKGADADALFMLETLLDDLGDAL